MSGINWTRAVLGALAAEIGQVGAAFAWVAIYSYAIKPGAPVAHYHEYAQLSGPYVSIVAGFPIFYLAARFCARNTATALALFAVFLVIDAGLLIAMSPGAFASGLTLIAASYGSKLLACYWGGRSAERRAA